MKQTAILMFFLNLFFNGCATTPNYTSPTQEQIAKLDYGSPITIDYQEAIKSYFHRRLFDPYSAVYEFATPQKYWVNRSPLYGGGLYAGYMVYVDVNAKNRMGGYVGAQRYGFLFKNDSIILVLNPDEMTSIKIQ